MRRRLSHLLVLLAWLLATGSQWDVAQLGAWGGMLARNAETLSWFDAVQKTFSGEGCQTCNALAAARAATSGDGENTPATGVASARFEIFQTPAALILSAPAELELGLAPGSSDPVGTPRASPLHRPPRRLA